MIPTTLTASSPSCNSLSQSTTINNCNANGTQNAISASSKQLIIGISSLILEGRAFAGDEYQILSMRQATPSPPRGPYTELETPPQSAIATPSSSASSATTSTSLHYGVIGAIESGAGGGGSGVGGGGGRQSPKPSTSKAAANIRGHHNRLINITTNPQHAFSGSTAPLFIETSNSYHSSSSAASSAESTHQRWTQKLCQLRQASVGANMSVPYEQKLAIEATQISRIGDSELVALAINDPSAAAERIASDGGSGGGGDFEIVRRLMRHRSTANSSINFGGSAAGGLSHMAGSSATAAPDNLLYSLQSLATTCLRGNNNPSIDSGGSSSSPKFSIYRAPTATPRFQSVYTSLDLQTGSASSSSGSSCGSGGLQSPKIMMRVNYSKRTTSTVTSCSSGGSVAPTTPTTYNNFRSKTSKLTPTSAAIPSSSTKNSPSSATSSSSTSSYPQQGPHCDQFLRKMGLAKGEAAEAEDHYCDMSFVNITCSRWRAYCLKMEAIIERGEPICIEVYLGPVGHKVLLEQWIIIYKEKVPPPTMTLPSLCSAIRSQLYFSQISAWCDLIRKSDKSIYETGRVICPTSSIGGCAAGDLATTAATAAAAQAMAITPPSGTSPNTNSNSISTSVTSAATPSATTTTLNQLTNAMLNRLRPPRLNIFYRVKQHDATACFNSKPIIHNFPNVNISENCSISVCLKSLPRINGGIPKIEAATAMMSAPSEHCGTTTGNNRYMGINVRNPMVIPPAAAAAATASAAAGGVSSNASKFSVDETPRSSRHQTIKDKSDSSSTLGTSPTTAATAIPTTTTTNSKSIAKAKAEAEATTNSNSSSSTSVARSGSSNCDRKKLGDVSTNGAAERGGGGCGNPVSGDGSNDNSNNFTCLYNCEQQMAASSSSSSDKTSPTWKVVGYNPFSKGSSPSSSSSMYSRKTAPLCTKCDFAIEDDDQRRDLSADAEDSVADFGGEDDFGDDVNEMMMYDANCSNGSGGSTGSNQLLSHRERQLMKYRKRMLKRDKKQQQRKSTPWSSSNSSSIMDCDKQQQQQQQKQMSNIARNHCQPMEQGDDDADDDADDDNDEEDESEQSSIQTVNVVTARHNNNQNNNNNNIEMISTGTQTQTSSLVGCCEQCGNQKAFVCLKCTRNSMPTDDEDDDDNEDHHHKLGTDEMDACSVNSGSSIDIISTPRSKADLLLQAIQRTPKQAAKHKKQTMRSTKHLSSAVSAPALNIKMKSSYLTTSATVLQNNNHHDGGVGNSSAMNGVSPSSSSSSLASSVGSGCQVCKRQKTQHNFGIPSSNNLEHIETANSNLPNSENEAPSLDNDGDGRFQKSLQIETNQELSERTTPRPSGNNDIMDEECFVSSTKLTPHFDRCALSTSQHSSVHSTAASTARSSCSNATMIPVPPLKLSSGSSSTHPPQCQRNCTQRSCTPPAVTSTTKTPSLVLTVDCEFKTPTSASQQSHHQHQHQQQQLLHFQKVPTPKPHLLQVAKVYAYNENTACCGSKNCSNNPINGLAIPMLMRKNLPKVNLTPIFCNSPSSTTGNCSTENISGGCYCCNTHNASHGSSDYCCSSSSPDSSAFPFDSVTISRVKGTASQSHHNNNNNSNNTATATTTTTTTTSDNSNSGGIVGLGGELGTGLCGVPVQKSYSAPTLPNSPSLSPRFAKQAAFYKRRSRHLSDRSDRSSLGSDELFSDEELECCGSGGISSSGATLSVNNNNNSSSSGSSIMLSPMKQRSRFAAAQFSRQPLLGNLEECLLQRRIMPKTEVSGFKVLLGASGGFCPTQLTIPAAAYFYELHGETLSTPYVCEIRLPRKGYPVPRSGTIQATLLNPLGTVVRMFVIPYDLRDMPPLHQTFIRQRVLVDMSVYGPTTTTTIATTARDSDIHHTTTISNTPMQESNRSLNFNDNIVPNQFTDLGVNGGDSSGGNGNGNGNGNGGNKSLGHFISAEHMKRLRYSIHLRFQTSRSGRLMLHTDIRLLISRRTDCDTAAAHAKGLLEAPNELIIDTVMPTNPKYSVRQDVIANIVGGVSIGVGVGVSTGSVSGSGNGSGGGGGGGGGGGSVSGSGAASSRI